MHKIIVPICVICSVGLWQSFLQLQRCRFFFQSTHLWVLSRALLLSPAWPWCSWDRQPASLRRWEDCFGILIIPYFVHLTVLEFDKLVIWLAFALHERFDMCFISFNFSTSIFLLSLVAVNLNQTEKMLESCFCNGSLLIWLLCPQRSRGIGSQNSFSLFYL